MTTLERELDLNLVDWDELSPVCDYSYCNNLGDIPAEQRHLHPVDCSNERRVWWVCKPCYEKNKSGACCNKCGQPAALFSI